MQASQLIGTVCSHILLVLERDQLTKLEVGIENLLQITADPKTKHII